MLPVTSISITGTIGCAGVRNRLQRIAMLARNTERYCKGRRNFPGDFSTSHSREYTNGLSTLSRFIVLRFNVVRLYVYIVACNGDTRHRRGTPGLIKWWVFVIARRFLCRCSLLRDSLKCLIKSLKYLIKSLKPSIKSLKSSIKPFWFVVFINFFFLNELQTGLNSVEI